MTTKNESGQDPIGTRKHRIPGKRQTAPYTAAPEIEVPEPKPKLYHKPKKKRNSDKSLERCSRDVRDDNDQTALTITIPQSTLQAVRLLSLDGQQRYAEDQSIGYATLSMTSPAALKSEHRNAIEHTRYKNESKTNQTDVGLGRQSPPFYTPRRPQHVKPESSSSDSDDDNNTPWGKRVTGIKVTRVGRNDDEVLVEDIPEGMLPVCPRCGVAVYQAEQKLAARRAFHDKCFKCCVCETFLDSLRVSERNGEIFCKSCYIRQFGPKGYDYGPGAGTLRME